MPTLNKQLTGEPRHLRAQRSLPWSSGFGDKWISWISCILNSASASVLLNGVPGKKIICRRGVRQGDPLSPQLYVLAAELLQYMINKAYLDGILSLPLDHSFGLSYPIIQYADDTLIILPACPTLTALQTIVAIFTSITGLKVNFQKSSLVPISGGDRPQATGALAWGVEKDLV